MHFYNNRQYCRLFLFAFFLTGGLFGNNICMNKLLAMLAVVIVIVALVMSSSRLVDALDSTDMLEITIYCAHYEGSAPCNGILYEVCCDTGSYSSQLLLCSDIAGYAVLVDNSAVTVEHICSMLSLTNVTNISSYSNCIYGYSPYLCDSIIIDSRRINVHIVTTSYGIMIGTPILLGSY